MRTRNSDEGLRKLERAAAVGGPLEQARLLTKKARSGEISSLHVEVAAALGHPIARLVLGGSAPKELKREYDQRLRAALAMAGPCVAAAWAADALERWLSVLDGDGKCAVANVIALARELAEHGSISKKRAEKVRDAAFEADEAAIPHSVARSVTSGADALAVGLTWFSPKLTKKNATMMAIQTFGVVSDVSAAAYRAAEPVPPGEVGPKTPKRQKAHDDEKAWAMLRLAEYLLGERRVGCKAPGDRGADWIKLQEEEEAEEAKFDKIFEEILAEHAKEGRKKRNSDEGLRRLERLARSGDSDAVHQLAREWVRRGIVRVGSPVTDGHGQKLIVREIQEHPGFTLVVVEPEVTRPGVVHAMDLTVLGLDIGHEQGIPEYARVWPRDQEVGVTRRNSDERLRRLERAWLTARSDSEALHAYVRELERTGRARSMWGSTLTADLTTLSDTDLQLLQVLGELPPVTSETSERLDAIGREIERRKPPLPVIVRAWEDPTERRRRLRPGETERFWVRGRLYDPPSHIEGILRRAGARIAPRSKEYGELHRPEVVVFSGLTPFAAQEAMRHAGLYLFVEPKTWGGDALPELRQSPSLIFLFPTEFCAPPDECDSVMWERDRGRWRFGSWECANYRAVTDRTRAATDEEVAPAIAAFSEEFGRRLRVYARSKLEFDLARRAAARR